MSSTRRFCVAVGAVAFLASLAFLQLVHAEGKRAIMALKEIQLLEDPGTQPATYTNAISFPRDRRAQQIMQRGAELIAEKQWTSAARELQFLLDKFEDSFVHDGPDDANKKSSSGWISIRAKATKLIGSMPREGLEEYEILCGGLAADQLSQAIDKHDSQMLAMVAHRYLHTKAGARATELLGTLALEREEPLMAALYFERLLDRKNAEPSAQLLLKATLAYYRAGDKASGDEIYKKLDIRARRDGGVRTAGQLVPIDTLRAELDKVPVADVKVALDWPYYRGGPNRSVQGIGGPPFLEPVWEISTLPKDKDVKVWVDRFIGEGTTFADQRGLANLPAFFPIAVGNKLVYRTYDGIYVANLTKEGKHEWWNFTTGGALALVSEPNKKAQLDQWSGSYTQYGPKSILYENSILGTLSTDNTRIFAIDDLIMTPHPMYMRQYMHGGQPNFGHLDAMVNRNTLKCYNVESGKLMWELGDLRDNSDLKDSFFLGAPLPLAGKIYVLNEKDMALRLVCLEPKDTNENPVPPTIVWTQTLATTKDKIQFDFNRRIHASNLAYGDGILICPTNAGAVLGVNLLSHSLEWAHSYREATEPKAKGGGEGAAVPFQGKGGFAVMDGSVMPMGSLTNEWKVSAPAVQDGKVVFTAPDGSAVHCINLRDGKLNWAANRGADDLYFAGVYNGKAVIVSKNSVRALNLVDGKEVWRLDNTGMPSGQGVASDNVYFLPVKASADTKEPEVLSIDVSRGAVVAHTKVRKRDGKFDVPGNLIFHDGQVLSQSIDKVASFPQLKVKLAKIDELLAKNPSDPVGLTERGELRLDKGELQGAIDDLHQAARILGDNPGGDLAPLVPKVRHKLYESMTQLIQDDFGKGERYLDEYRELCKHETAEEQVKRQSNFLCLLANGREKQGRLLDAFQAYMDFGTLNGNRELVSVIDQANTKSRPDVWARGRIAAMMAHATAEQRQPLDDKIAEQWQTIKDSNDIDALRRFVSLFGAAFKVGKQAKLRLADKLMVENKEEGLRDAQLLLLQLYDQKSSAPELAALAVDGLARLHMQKGIMENAILYYKELGSGDFAKIVIRDGKTGADIWNELATDKRFLPYLDTMRQTWGNKFKVTDVTGNNQPQQQFTLEALGDQLPFFQRHRVVLEVNTQALRIVDQLTNEERFRIAGLGTVVNYLVNHGHQNVRVTYQVKGTIAVVNLGHMVYGFDPIDKKKLWEYNLLGAGGAVPMQNVMRDRDGNLVLVYQDGFIQRIGQAGPVEASYVCLQTRDGLVALDPAKGSVLWTKSGVSARTQLFGDDQYVYLVDMNADGLASSGARAVRAQDGVMVQVPDFTEAYQKKLRVIGRTILVKDEDPQGALVLRLYDAHTGKDLWKKSFPANSVLLKTEDDLAGAIEPDGAVTVFDPRTQKEVLKSSLNWKEVLDSRGLDVAKVLDKVTEAHLLQDRNQFYIALNKPMDPAAGINGMWTNVHMMRSVTVNGMMYAFDKGTGKATWAELVANQHLVLEQFKDLPVLLFTVRYNKKVGAAFQHMMGTKTILKTNGRLLYDKEINNGNQFHSVLMDGKNHTIDLVSWNFRVRHTLETEQAK